MKPNPCNKDKKILMLSMEVYYVRRSREIIRGKKV